MLVVLSCARAKSFPGGSDGPTARTPAIDAVARSGLRVPRAVAPTGDTIASHRSICTGRYPIAHRASPTADASVAPSTLARRLGARGYDTALFSELESLLPGPALDRGFGARLAGGEVASGSSGPTADERGEGAPGGGPSRWRGLLARVPPIAVPLAAIRRAQQLRSKRRASGPGTVRGFERWVERRARDRPFFVILDLVDARAPYDLDGRPTRFGRAGPRQARVPTHPHGEAPGMPRSGRGSDVYRGYLRSLEAADFKVGRIVRALEVCRELDRTFLVVTADHGQTFGEGRGGPLGTSVTDAVARVPLVMRPPAELDRPSRLDRWTSLCELVPWIMGAADGRSSLEDPDDLPESARPGVFCEGAPAPGSAAPTSGNGGPGGAPPTVLAAYRGDSKFALDRVTGELLRWREDGTDIDGRPGEYWTGREARILREELFGAYERCEPVASGSPVRLDGPGG